MRAEDAPYSVKHCNQCLSLREFVEKKEELHGILDASKKASLAQSELQPKALIKTHDKLETIKEFKTGLRRYLYKLQKVSDRENRPNYPMPPAHERQLYGRGFPTLPREARNLNPHPDREFHEEMLNNMLVSFNIVSF
ncbi:unnamed protein product [Haemonchus placei]|uniref:Uncharacterized protein n=1 Tax=Haemonchus placei TaxID=6290 RepID=A0A0N4XBW0_HAEPC|nr:unnamed protein product [Haemonchus placei]